VQDRQAALDVFVGRAAEIARVAEVVARVQAGQPWLVAIEGDPGVGKTALARRCLAQSGLKVLPARADQAETDLEFGLVDQLLRAAGRASPPVLPADGTGPAASSFTVGARLLDAVGGQQAAGAVAILVDDLQWADTRSVEALTFMLRRLSVDPLLAVVIYRGPGAHLNETAQWMLRSVENRVRLSLGGLSPEEVGSLAAELGRLALDTGRLDGGAASQTRTMIAIGVAQVSGPRDALAERATSTPTRSGSTRPISTRCRFAGSSAC
jgi:AAA ATPase domain